MNFAFITYEKHVTATISNEYSLWVIRITRQYHRALLARNKKGIFIQAHHLGNIDATHIFVIICYGSML